MYNNITESLFSNGAAKVVNYSGLANGKLKFVKNI